MVYYLISICQPVKIPDWFTFLLKTDNTEFDLKAAGLPVIKFLIFYEGENLSKVPFIKNYRKTYGSDTEIINSNLQFTPHNARS